MDSEKTESGASSVSTDNTNTNLLSRVMGSADFLTLEHVGYFVLVVLIPAILLSGFSNAVALWSSIGSGSSSSLDMLISGLMASNTTMAIMTCAALVVLVPLMFVLRRRVSAEYAKRSGYTERVAYKLPVYAALGVLAALAVGSFVGMMNVFLNSLVNIGVSGVNIGNMYINQFLPALLSFVVFGASAWYVMLFAKGKDMSKVFIGLSGLLSGALVIALFITAMTINHQPNSSNGGAQIQPYPLQDSSTDYPDYFDY